MSARPLTGVTEQYAHVICKCLYVCVPVPRVLRPAIGGIVEQYAPRWYIIADVVLSAQPRMRGRFNILGPATVCPVAQNRSLEITSIARPSPTPTAKGDVADQHTEVYNRVKYH